jgi:hypothetical protein
MKVARTFFAKLLVEEFIKSQLQINQSVIGDIEKSFSPYCSLLKVKHN